MSIFDANYGVLNGILLSIGAIDSPIAWLFQTDTARVALIVAETCEHLPLDHGDAPRRAADRPGPAPRSGGAWTAPAPSGGSSPSPGRTSAASQASWWLLEFIWNFQHFDTIFVLTGGGPAGTTNTFATEVYDTAFKGYDLGHAGALGILWMALLTVLVVVYVWLSERGEKGAHR